MVVGLHIDNDLTFMKRIIIVGAGGFGREVYGWLLDVLKSQPDWELGGFLDARTSALNGLSIPLNVIGDPLSYQPSTDDRFICGLGDPLTRLHICEHIKAVGGQFARLVHPTVFIGPNCSLGEGCVLCPGAGISTNVTLGDFVVLNGYATVGHDAVIGDDAMIDDD